MTLRERAAELQRQGAKAWRVAPDGAIQGFRRFGSIKAARWIEWPLWVTGALGSGTLCFLLVCPLIGYNVVSSADAALAQAVREIRADDRPLTPAEVLAWAAIPLPALQTVAKIVTSQQPPQKDDWLSKMASASTVAVDGNRARVLVTLLGKLSANGQDPIARLDRLNAVLVALSDDGLRNAIAQLLSLPQPMRDALFANEAQRLKDAIEAVERSPADRSAANKVGPDRRARAAERAIRGSSSRRRKDGLTQD